MASTTKNKTAKRQPKRVSSRYVAPMSDERDKLLALAADELEFQREYIALLQRHLQKQMFVHKRYEWLQRNAAVEEFYDDGSKRIVTKGGAA